MTDYNDGKWHAWNGGECPVHPETEVYVTYPNGNRQSGPAEHRDWAAPLLFRVTKEHREPREFWLVGHTVYPSLESAKMWNDLYPQQKLEIIHVIEKLED